MTEKGAVVAFCMANDVVITAQVVAPSPRRSGRDQEQVILVDASGDVYEWETLDLLAPSFDSKSVKDTRNAVGRQLQRPTVQKTIHSLTEIPKPHLRIARVVYREVMPEPAPGRGHPEIWEVPMKLARGFSSELHPDFERYLNFWWIRYERTLDRLLDWHPSWGRVWIYSMHDGWQLAQIADAMSLRNGRPVKKATVRKWKERARDFIRDECGDSEEWEGTMPQYGSRIMRGPGVKEQTDTTRRAA